MANEAKKESLVTEFKTASTTTSLYNPRSISYASARPPSAERSSVIMYVSDWATQH